MGIVQSLVFRRALGVGEIAERTCAQDGGVEVEMELRETLGRAILLALALGLGLLVLLGGRRSARGGRASAFERLGCVVEGKTFGEGTLFWILLRG